MEALLGSLSHPFVILVDMAFAQLHLLDFDDELWKLDDRTIRVGRKGLVSARAALARSTRPYDGPAHPVAA